MAIPVDLILTGITVLVAIVGTVWHEPNVWVQCLLVVLAVAAGAGSIFKHYQDAADKTAWQTALFSTLRPSNAEYQKFYPDVSKSAFPPDQQDADYDCHHSQDGLTCFLISGKLVAVFNRAEVATMYANVIKGDSNQGVIKGVLNKRFGSEAEYEELLDKIGILGMHTYFNMFDRFPESYEYDPRFGVRVDLRVNKAVHIKPEEITESTRGKTAGAAFGAIGMLYREKYKAEQTS